MRRMLVHAAAGGLLLAGCTGDIDGIAAGDREMQTFTDEVVGVTVTMPAELVVRPDPVLFDTHGFIVYGAPEDHAAGHDDGAVARVALAYQAQAEDLDALVAEKLAQYADVNPEVVEVTLGDGTAATAITGLPGTQPYSVVYAADGERVWEIGLWSREEGQAIDARGRAVLAGLVLEPPAKAVESRGLTAAAQALYGDPPDEFLELSRDAAAERRALFEAAAAEDLTLAEAAATETHEPPVPVATPEGSAAATCGFTAPASLYWQLQWDNTNTFYSGTWYSLRNRPGWSAMSGNYGSWWGTNFHIWKCNTGVLNQWFANDWPAQYWANAYAAFSGYVEWAGWGTDGFASLGRYVVVRNGKYRSLTAHLTRIASGVTWGKWINGYWKVIGYAGDTGEYYANADWAPHLHARVGWGESLTYNGQPYGGHSVRPRSLRCFACKDYDVNAPGEAGGYYNRFWHGRWMRY